MSFLDLFTAAERRLAALLFLLSAAGLVVRAGRHVSPEVAVWLGEVAAPPADSTTAGSGGAAEADPAPSPAAPTPAEQTLIRVDPNTAGADELQVLPGIGPALAGRILADRAANGPYATPRDLLRVSGIGPATLRRIEPYLELP